MCCDLIERSFILYARLENWKVLTRIPINTKITHQFWHKNTFYLAISLNSRQASINQTLHCLVIRSERSCPTP